MPGAHYGNWQQLSPQQGVSHSTYQQINYLEYKVRYYRDLSEMYKRDRDLAAAGMCTQPQSPKPSTLPSQESLKDIVAYYLHRR